MSHVKKLALVATAGLFALGLGVVTASSASADGSTQPIFNGPVILYPKPSGEISDKPQQ
ncbi:hypothetical protein GCM10009850_085160 [Nonomuraea monospora]|uniref:Secreted protein n=1 Tax=Nonomuraea monospora TaxID=568818 RepID=A0ABN3CUB9_9ACTN